MVEYWLEMPAAEEAATDRQQLTVARHAAAGAKGRTAKWLEMKIPGPHTRSTNELRGTYATRAEARRRQQQLESEQANRPEPHRHVRIEDNSGDAAM